MLLSGGRPTAVCDLQRLAQVPGRFPTRYPGPVMACRPRCGRQSVTVATGRSTRTASAFTDQPRSAGADCAHDHVIGQGYEFRARAKGVRDSAIWSSQLGSRHTRRPDTPGGQSAGTWPDGAVQTGPGAAIHPRGVKPWRGRTGGSVSGPFPRRSGGAGHRDARGPTVTGANGARLTPGGMRSRWTG